QSAYHKERLPVRLIGWLSLPRFRVCIRSLVTLLFVSVLAGGQSLSPARLRLDKESVIHIGLSDIVKRGVTGGVIFDACLSAFKLFLFEEGFALVIAEGGEEVFTVEFRHVAFDHIVDPIGVAFFTEGNLSHYVGFGEYFFTVDFFIESGV